jgi:precorrin-2 dehydrogenase/sirohydrochlorin ferrochelatase
VVIGGGAVGTRKARTFLDAGARVTVITVDARPEIEALAKASDRLSIERRPYGGQSDIESADIVVAATDSVDTNLRIAEDARQLHRIVSVVNAPLEGSFTSMAVHRADNLTIGVTAGRAPREAVRVRDEIARRFAELNGETA